MENIIHESLLIKQLVKGLQWYII